jgi:teichuronic acid biosynthesis protein TuaF
MGLMIQRLKGRLNKYFLLLLAATILLGVIGWFLPVGKEKSSYQAEAVIKLGFYKNPELNDPKRVVTLFTENAPFYEEHIEKLWPEKNEFIRTNLLVTATTDNMIKLSYTDDSKEISTQVLSEITSAFMSMDQGRFKQKQGIIQESIEALNNETVAPEGKVDQHRFLLELETALYDIKPATLFKPADKDEIINENRAFNSKERAVLGVLLGLTLSFFWIVIPEFFRDRSYE